MTTRFRAVSLALLLGFTAAAPAAVAPTTAIQSSTLEAPPADETFTVGLLRVQRYGKHGRPLILIPGTESGSWAWKGQIERFRGSHAIYAVTLVFLGMGFVAFWSRGHLVPVLLGVAALLLLLSPRK